MDERVPARRLLNKRHLAEALDITTGALEHWVAAKKLRKGYEYYRLGRVNLYDLDAVLKRMAKLSLDLRLP